jgi:hypothetical protein
MRFSLSVIALACCCRLLIPDRVWAHGESVRGIGSTSINTTGGTIADGASLSLRYDRRAYRLFREEELLDFRAAGEDVHQHAREESFFLSSAVGLADNWELDLQLPINRFTGFVDNGDEFAIANQTLSRTDTAEGLGDLLALAKWRFFEKDDRHLAALFGLKLPTGNYRQRTNNGDLVGTHNQPGTGSTDFQLGGAYTAHYFEDFLEVSADLFARVNGEGAGRFRSGNSIQSDVSFGLWPHSSLSPVVEFNFIVQERDLENDAVKRNSGARSLFVSPGLRYCLTAQTVVFANASFPVWQDLPGIQNNESYRISVGVGFGI